MKKLVCLYILLLSSVFCIAQNDIKISLLTFEPGMDSASLFGHTAVRVQNSYQETDIVYSFGVFDFETPNFLAKFATGKLDYYLGIQDFDQTLIPYSYEKRQVSEQILNFSTKQKQLIVEKLDFLYRPENRFYRYGFLQRNCSTEIRDLLLTAVEGVDYTTVKSNNTYRKYLKDYTKEAPWFKFGINLALGSTIDREITTYELMFLPDYLSQEMEKATINDGKLAKQPEKLLANIEKQEPTKWQLTPFILFSFLFVLMVLGRSKVIIQTFTFCVGAGGLLILIISLFSAHPEVQKNYNLLWCNPLYLLSFGLCFTNYIKFHKIFAVFMTLGIVAMIFIWVTKIQGFDIGFFPVCLSLFWINLKQVQRKYRVDGTLVTAGKKVIDDTENVETAESEDDENKKTE